MQLFGNEVTHRDGWYRAKLKGALQASKVSVLDNDPLSADRLRDFVNLGIHDWNQVLLDRVATRFLAHAPANAINAFIEVWGDAPDQIPFLYCEFLFTLSISHPQAVKTALAVIRKVGLPSMTRPTGTIFSLGERLSSGQRPTPQQVLRLTSMVLSPAGKSR